MKLARITPFVAAALAVLAAVPVTVLGARLPRGAHYAGKTDSGGDVTLRLSGDGRRVARLRIDYTLECEDGNSGDTYTVIMQARLHGVDHSFRAQGSYTGSRDGSINKFQLEGHVSRHSARGTFSLENESRDDGLNCSSGKLRWHASRR